MNKIIVVFWLLFICMQANAKIVRYELVAKQKQVNLSGKKAVDFAIAINDQIPAPTLDFTEGDEAEITVRNQIPNQELSLHWHGILLPVEMDGVPYVTTPTIHSGESFVFRFPIRQSGTYWYHSHTNVQEQKGVYGAFVIQPKVKTLKYDKEAVAVLSDWSDEDALSILKNLRKDGDYYLYKKGTMRSWFGALQAGALGNYFYNEWTRMGGMDFSDVGYDAFLINGKTDSQLVKAKAGDRIRIRLINAAASTYFHVALGNEQVQVVSADGIDVTPVKAKEILMGMAETYDILFTVPEKKNYELKITAQDGTGTASAWIGEGQNVLAPLKPFPDMYATMDHSAHHNHGAHAGHDMSAMSGEHAGHDMSTMSGEHAGHDMSAMNETKIETLTVDNLKALKSTLLPKNAPRYDLELRLGGDMERYIWHINGKAIHQDRTIEIKEGDVVRFTFVNETMMHHPMHLHGHFFRVLTDKGDYSPLKHTVDVPPHGTRVIEFYANEPGEWMLHCHNLYHLKNGMARVIKYLSYTPRPEVAHMQHDDPHHHDHIYYRGMLEAATNHGQARLSVFKTWDEIDGRFEVRKNETWNLEGDLFYRRWFGQFFNLVLGGTSVEDNHRAVVGATYILPMLVHATLLIDHKADFRLDLEKRFQWTKYIFTDVDVTLRQRLESEFEVTLMFAPNWTWAGGIMLTEDSIGAGLQFQF